MTLSAMENAVGNVNAHAKLQNLLGQAGEEEAEVVAKDDDLIMEEQMYRSERLNRKLYHDVDLHVTFIELIVLLMIDINGFAMEPFYTNQFPMRVLKSNVPFVLRLHLNHPENDRILGTSSFLELFNCCP